MEVGCTKQAPRKNKPPTPLAYIPRICIMTAYQLRIGIEKMTPMQYTIEKAKSQAKRDVEAKREANSGAKIGSAYHEWYMAAYATYSALAAA